MGWYIDEICYFHLSTQKERYLFLLKYETICMPIKFKPCFAKLNISKKSNFLFLFTAKDKY